MFNLSVYNLKEFSRLENMFLSCNKNNEIVVMCIGTKKYFNDCFGVLLGDKLKKLNIYVYGSSKREINGLNYLNVYKFIKRKHYNAKIIIIDSVFIKGDKKPVLIYKNGGINVSGLNSDILIGDEGILFNSFSYSNLDYLNNSIILINNLFHKFIKKRCKYFEKSSYCDTLSFIRRTKWENNQKEKIIGFFILY